MKYITLLVSVLILSACAGEPTKEVKIVSKPIEVAAPIVPRVDEISTRPVEWIVVTEQNFQSVLMRLRDAGDEQVLLAITAADYQDLILNQGDILTALRQQKRIIILYENSYK